MKLQQTIKNAREKKGMIIFDIDFFFVMVWLNIVKMKSI